MKSDNTVCKQIKKKKKKKSEFLCTYRSWMCFQIYILTKSTYHRSFMHHQTELLNFRFLCFEAQKSSSKFTSIMINDTNQRKWWFNVYAELREQDHSSSCKPNQKVGLLYSIEFIVKTSKYLSLSDEHF